MFSNHIVLQQYVYPNMIFSKIYLSRKNFRNLTYVKVFREDNSLRTWWCFARFIFQHFFPNFNDFVSQLTARCRHFAYTDDRTEIIWLMLMIIMHHFSLFKTLIAIMVIELWVYITLLSWGCYFLRWHNAFTIFSVWYK